MKIKLLVYLFNWFLLFFSVLVCDVLILKFDVSFMY